MACQTGNHRICIVSARRSVPDAHSPPRATAQLPSQLGELQGLSDRVQPPCGQFRPATPSRKAGIASRDDIDNAAKLGYGFPMGPLQLADLIGLDVLINTGNARYEELKDPWFAPPPILKRMVLAGRLGRKSGKGFYDYD